MANADSSKRNSVWMAAAINLTPQSANPIPAGNAGLWLDSNGILQQTFTDGTVLPSGRSYKAACRLATAAALPACTYSASAKTLTADSNGALNDTGIDSVTTVAVGDRILVKNEVAGANRGIYVVTSIGGALAKWVFTRAADFAFSSQVTAALLVPIAEGTVNGDTVYELSTNNPITLGSTSLTFSLAPLSITYAEAGDMVSVDVSAASAGVANKVLRGDAKLALSLSIAPDWTGIHRWQHQKAKLWNAGGTFSARLGSLGTGDHDINFPDAAGTIALTGSTTSSSGTGASGAPSSALACAGHVRYQQPIAAELISIVADGAVGDGALVIASQPAYPRKLQIRKTDGDSSYSATVTIVGVGPGGEAIAGEVVSLLAVDGTHTYTTANAYAKITSITVSATAGAGAGDNIGVGVSTAFGLPIPSGAGSVVVYKAAVAASGAVTAADETVGTVDATARTIVPTTAPDASKSYDFWFSYTLASHTHTGPAHTHTNG